MEDYVPFRTYDIDYYYRYNTIKCFPFFCTGYMEGYVPFRTYDMDYYRSLVNKPAEKKTTDVPFKILNPELLPYNIVKNYSKAKTEHSENAPIPDGESNLKKT
jgi:hypothetical protein